MNMNYLVLARKYRPQIWDDVVAQDHVTATIRNAIKHNRLAHAYLFSGPRGVGKTTAARLLAKALNCEQGPTITPCNVCSNCIEITENRSVDVFEVDGASNRGIDEVRNLRENIKYMPTNGQYRIYIIDEVHMLTNEAFNALLKTLEEPPSHVIFIFATTEPHKVPATILSRCQRFDFRRIAMTHIIARLEKICNDENIEVEKEALLIIARKADGSLRDGLSILDQIISFTGQKITTADVVKGLGIIEEELFFQTTEIILEGDVKKGLDLVESVVAGGYDIEEFLIGYSEHLRNILLVRGMGNTDLVEATEPQKLKFMELSKQLQEEDILRLIQVTLQALNGLKRAVHPRLPLELAIVKMIRMDRTVALNDLIQQISQMGVSPQPTIHSVQQSVSKPPSQPEKAIATSPSIQSKVSESFSPKMEQNIPDPLDEMQPDQNDPKPVQNEGDISLDHINQKWNDVICQVKKEKITIGSFLAEGVILGIENNVIQIGFSPSNSFHMDSVTRTAEAIQTVIQNVYGHSLRIKCLKKDLPEKKNREFKTDTQKQEELSTRIQNEPLIKKIVEDFDAEIIDQ